jgi:adenylate cyclase
MGDDDEQTVSTITTYREIIAELIEKGLGRVVDAPGDNILAEFDSSLNAVQSAIAIQNVLKIENEKMPDNRRMDFRIGINLGDIIHKDDRIYGDGVNIAARIESLADPGGICISRGVFDQVDGKLEIGFADLGPNSVKNIRKPVNIYKVLLDPKDAGKIVDATKAKSRIRRWMVVSILGLVVVLSGVGIWHHQTKPAFEPASVDRMTYPLPDKPSIAVLPFVNMSDDPQQEYFVDGITNDIITALSEFKFLFIIASTSSFAYKGKPLKVQEVSEELGVRYVLEGSVQRTSDRMRINAQLIDATTGKHLWAKRYDRDAQRLFDIQDEIVETIVATLAFEVDAVERERVARKKPKKLDAYDFWLRGRNAWFGFTKEANAKAGELFDKAIDLDPNWARPYGYMAWVHVNNSRFGWSENPENSMEIALEWAQKCFALDPNDYKTHWALGIVHLHLRDFELAKAGYERALALNSNDADFLAEMSLALTYMGRPEQAIAQLKKAMRMNPRHPSWYRHILGFAYYEVGQYKEALATLKQDNKPFFLTHRTLAAVYVRLGRFEEARAEVSKMFDKNPYYTLESENHRPYNDDTRRERLVKDLRKAGVTK